MSAGCDAMGDPVCTRCGGTGWFGFCGAAVRCPCTKRGPDLSFITREWLRRHMERDDALGISEPESIP